MKFIKNIVAVFISLFLAVLFSGCSDVFDPGIVKEPAVAGLFYSADKEKLRNTVDGFLSQAKNQPVDGRLVAVISPHAS